MRGGSDEGGRGGYQGKQSQREDISPLSSSLSLSAFTPPSIPTYFLPTLFTHSVAHPTDPLLLLFILPFGRCRAAAELQHDVGMRCQSEHSSQRRTDNTHRTCPMAAAASVCRASLSRAREPESEQRN
eukprot:2948987-Rhodomonas_salina.1